ncbi:hypothetical protein H5410_006030 [Solanum commersonii]|uniref:Zinc finger PMZ-type domain-containing protein n=1 Tax=Solanum commersonii TaxID=4109 RepID=A0A9J6A930_SOLCO|nr:hypothetical protein H5410_006030 [Solanum commersonii]
MDMRSQKVVIGIYTVNMILKRCTCMQWDLNGIPCPAHMQFLQCCTQSVHPLSEMSWWYSKEAFLLTYRHKLQPVRSEIFWKVDPHQAMEPLDLVKMVGRPKTKRVRKKDEAIKRQGEWASSRKGRVMTCLRPSIPSVTPDFELSETSKQRSSKPDDTTLQHPFIQI